jgi:hypothetical protein
MWVGSASLIFRREMLVLTTGISLIVYTFYPVYCYRVAIACFSLNFSILLYLYLSGAFEYIWTVMVVIADF